MRRALLCGLLMGCVAELPIEETGDPPDIPPTDTADTDVELTIYKRDCTTLPLPEVTSIESLPKTEPTIRVMAPFAGYTFDRTNPPAKIALRAPLSESFLEWVATSGAHLDRGEETWIQDFNLNGDAILAPCEYLPTCAAQPCGQDDLWNQDGTPRYHRLVGWIHDEIELYVWD